MRLHILLKMSRENDHSSTKFKSKHIVSFANGSGNYKLIECKGDSSVLLIDSFSFFLFFFVVFFGRLLQTLLNT